MKTRQEIKQLAREGLNMQRSTAIFIILIYLGIAIISGLLTFIPFIGIIVYLAGISATIIVSVSACSNYVSIYKKETTSIDNLISNAQVNPLRKLGGMLWTSLFIFLWSLLFYIPGIIKALAYSMTPYILAEHPNVGAKQALKISMRMTEGHKMELFVFQLSFIGWILLSGLTLYILGIVYVFPYMQTATAGYFIELRDRALASGAITYEELGMGKTEQY